MKIIWREERNLCVLERGGNFLLSPASAPGEVLISIFDWTVSVTRNDFLVSSEPNVGILI